MNSTVIFYIFVLIVIFACEAAAGSFGVGLHAGYGEISHEEKHLSDGEVIRSESSQNAVIAGVSGEYTFSSSHNIFAGLTTDWIVGVGGREHWVINGIRPEEPEMEFFGQFYDFRFGYKGWRDEVYYRAYISGGWDGLRFERNIFYFGSYETDGDVREDISLWRAGIGGAFGFRRGRWAIDTRAAYAFYPKGTAEYSSFPGAEFSTNGTCVDLGAGLAFAVSKRVNLYVGGSYTLIELDGESSHDGEMPAGFPESRTELAGGVINLGYSF
jgi:hypothetical protein